MFSNVDNIEGIDAVKLAQQKRPPQKPSTECIIEGLKICLYNNNSNFDQDLLQGHSISNDQEFLKCPWLTPQILLKLKP